MASDYVEVKDLKLKDWFMEETFPETWEVTKVGVHTGGWPMVEAVVVKTAHFRPGVPTRLGERAEWWVAPDHGAYRLKIFRV